MNDTITNLPIWQKLIYGAIAFALVISIVRFETLFLGS